MPSARGGVLLPHRPTRPRPGPGRGGRPRPPPTAGPRAARRQEGRPAVHQPCRGVQRGPASGWSSSAPALPGPGTRRRHRAGPRCCAGAARRRAPRSRRALSCGQARPSPPQDEVLTTPTRRCLPVPHDLHARRPGGRGEGGPAGMQRVQRHMRWLRAPRPAAAACPRGSVPVRVAAGVRAGDRVDHHLVHAVLAGELRDLRGDLVGGADHPAARIAVEQPAGARREGDRLGLLDRQLGRSAPPVRSATIACSWGGPAARPPRWSPRPRR